MSVRRAVGWGLGAGALAGAVVGIVLATIVLGTDGTEWLGGDEASFVYVVALVVGVGVGAVTGLVGTVAATRVAQTSTASPSSRRARGALAAAAVSGLAAFLTTSPFLGALILVWLLVAAALGGGLAWWMLPRLVDLDAPPVVPAQDLPAYGTPPGTAAVRPPASRRRTALWAIGLAAVAFYPAGSVSGQIAYDVTASRGAADVLALAGAVLGSVVVAVVTWVVMARRSPGPVSPTAPGSGS